MLPLTRPRGVEWTGRDLLPGIEYFDQTLHIGSQDATREQLDLLEGHNVSVEVVQ